MLKISLMALIFWALGGCIFVGADDDSPPKEPVPDYERLESKDGRTFEECHVKRVESDALIIEHRDGMARISFFDLSPEIQSAYDFDPIEALAAYKKNIAMERELRKNQLLESEKQRAEAQHQAEKEQFYEEAKREWIPSKGTIIKVNGQGAYAELWRISFVPTKETSVLGFEKEGTPKRVMKKIGKGLVFLKQVGPDFSPGDKWEGFVDPISKEYTISPKSRKNDIPVYRCVSRR
tara:strand:- start:674 stop:1381 length:708 start_codon:yes stop_codon:yes gene_type:complete